MVTYPDTSFLVTLYLIQKDSAKAASFMRHGKPSLICTLLHSHELRNAIRLAVFRKEITKEQCQGALQAFEDDLKEGVLIQPSLVWKDAFRAAERLSEAYTGKLGNRGIDILHVATALTLGTKSFLTFDRRQIGLARACSLRVPLE